MVRLQTRDGYSICRQTGSHISRHSKTGSHVNYHSKSTTVSLLKHMIKSPETWTVFSSPTHHSDSVSDGFGRQVAAELGSDHPAVTVSPGHLSPDDSGLVGFTSRCHGVPADRKHTIPLVPQDLPAGWIQFSETRGHSQTKHLESYAGCVTSEVLFSGNWTLRSWRGFYLSSGLRLSPEAKNRGVRLPLNSTSYKFDETCDNTFLTDQYLSINHPDTENCSDLTRLWNQTNILCRVIGT